MSFDQKTCRVYLSKLFNHFAAVRHQKDAWANDVHMDNYDAARNYMKAYAKLECWHEQPNKQVAEVGLSH